MAYEKSAGCVVFREEKGDKRYYLLLYKKASDHYKESWAFPKGLVEAGENEQETATRETKEEAGITDLQVFPGFKERIHYIYKKDGQMISKDVIYFLAKTEQEQAKVSTEHEDYAWLTYEKAINKVTFKSDKEILEKAEAYLKKTTTSNLSKFF